MSTSQVNIQDSGHDMMLGTNGLPNYLIVARKGDIGLGVTPSVMKFHHEKKATYISVRIRSARVKLEGIANDTVVTLAHRNLAPETAWPGVEWEKADSVRASAHLGVFMEGTSKHSPEKLLESMEDKSLASNLSDYLINIAGVENLHITREEIISWFNDVYMASAERIKQMLKEEAAIDTEIADSLGVFQTQMSLMKKTHGALTLEQDDEEEEEKEESAPDDPCNSPDDSGA